jgi:hypothetical protein
MALTWRCHICGIERPDDKISVRSNKIISDNGYEMTENICYCNDIQDCIEKSKTFSFRKEE